ncbi:hypothetical protein GX51_05298 [Blastomyces parvus]|uniref:Uncharacterized protein n=1 Tax=Blastomyces parvus TaxID=2060905 RepID=A0A2B7WX35_9EURO|nr:hypothetical protein GX51_05298 [Blastomyces parvus]
MVKLMYVHITSMIWDYPDSLAEHPRGLEYPFYYNQKFTRRFFAGDALRCMTEWFTHALRAGLHWEGLHWDAAIGPDDDGWVQLPDHYTLWKITILTPGFDQDF